MTKLVIFDLDGTLLNTVADLEKATNYALRKLGYAEREAEEYNFLCGRGIYNLFRMALPKEASNEENVKKMAELFLPYYDEHKCDYTRPYDGIPELLEELARDGIKIAIASNKYQEGAEKLISHFFGKLHFLKILGQSKGRPIKPDPAIVEQIMSEAPEIKKDEVIYIGDSDVDMQTGKNAGVKTIGVTWGFRSREELEANSPWKIADNTKELYSYIKI